MKTHKCPHCNNTNVIPADTGEGLTCARCRKPLEMRIEFVPGFTTGPGARIIAAGFIPAGERMTLGRLL